MPTYKYKNNHHGSLYVPGEQLLPDSSLPPMPPVKQSKKEKIRRIYEDNDFVIDLIHSKDPAVRVSIFKDGHYKDEVIIRKEDYID